MDTRMGPSAAVFPDALEGSWICGTTGTQTGVHVGVLACRWRLYSLLHNTVPGSDSFKGNSAGILVEPMMKEGGLGLSSTWGLPLGWWYNS